MDLTATLVLVGICVVMEGFFSGTELALISINRHRLHHLVETGNRAAKLMEEQLKQPSRLYGTTSIGTNIFVVSGTALMTVYFIGKSPDNADLWAVLVMAPVTLLLGEIFPKTFFLQWSDRVSYIAIYPLVAAQKLFTPILWVTSGITNIMLGMLGVEEKHDIKTITHEEIRRIYVMGEKEFELHPEEKKMIRRIFDFKKTTVEQCMVPLIHITAAEKREPIDSVRQKFHKYGYSRLPVYDEKIYNITGIINSFDVLRYGQEALESSELARPAFYVYQSKKINDLLAEMQDTGVQMAIVVNEYSAAVGAVTREDLIEEIFGEIEDEYDKTTKLQKLKRLGTNLWELDARAEVDLINEQYGWNLPTGDYETVAGLILSVTERIPGRWEKITIGDFRFKIKEVTAKGIHLVEISGIKEKLKDSE